MNAGHAVPLEIVSALRTAAYLQDKTGRASALELLDLARELELWTVHNRKALEAPGPRATPTNLQLMAAALDEAATIRKPHQRIKSVAVSLRNMASNLKRENEE
jgi:hypothetical protein